MKKIGRVFIGIGIVLILIPIIGRCYTYFKQEQLYNAYLEKCKLETGYMVTNDGNSTEGINNFSNHETLQQDDKVPQWSFQDGEVMGRIKIPSIGLDLILLEGESSENLKLGACHMAGTANPGGIGNCAIAGHRNYTFGSMFNRLNEVKVEDKVSIEMNGVTYDYKVIDSLIVEPTQVDVLKQPTDKKEITLITCHPLYTGTHRLIIRGELIDVVDE